MLLGTPKFPLMAIMFLPLFFLIQFSSSSLNVQRLLPSRPLAKQQQQKPAAVTQLHIIET